MKALNVRKCLLLNVLFSLFFFSACEMSFNEPLKEYLKEYTETAAIEKMDLPSNNYPKDKNGYISIPSSDDLQITFSMRNPQLYVLDFGLEFTDNAATTVASTFGGSAYTFRQSQDHLIVDLSLSQEYLNAMECGGNLSAKISLREPKTGRTFDSYSYSLKSNSEPEPVHNLVVLQDSSTGKYVLAMNMPDMSGIHKDIRKIKIDDSEYSLVLPAAPSKTDTGIDFSSYTNFVNAYDPSWVVGVAGSSFDGTTSDRVLYYKTNTAITTEELFFNVVLEDTEGLSVESKISERSKKLSQVSFPTDYDAMETNDDGYASFTINGPALATDGSAVDGETTVYYKVYDYDELAADHKGAVKKQGSGKNNVTVTLTNGKWICESWAHKIGFIDSTPYTGETAVQGFVYVNSSYTGEVRDGGRATPYKTVEEAMVGVAGFDTVKICLLSDVALAGPLTLNKHLEVKAANSYKITGAITVPNGYVLTVNDKACFEYIYVEEGGLIKTRAIPAGTSAIANVEYVPAIAGASLDGKLIIQPADSNALTEELIERFYFKNAGYFIDINNGSGVITVAGVKLRVDTINGNYEVKVTGLTNNAGTYTASAGTELKVAEIKNMNGEVVALDTVTAMNIYTEGTLVQTNAVAASKTSLTISNYAYGGTYNYILEVCFTIGGMPVSAQVPFTLE